MPSETHPIPAIEFAKDSLFVMFVPDGARYHVSEWYGYDLKASPRLMHRTAALDLCTELAGKGYARRETAVGPRYLGLACEHGHA